MPHMKDPWRMRARMNAVSILAGTRIGCKEEYERFIEVRKKMGLDSAIDYDTGYEEFKIGLLIKELRLKEGMTQEELAKKLHTKKSVISQMENHSEDIRLSTLEKVAAVFGKRLQIAIEE